VRQLLGFDGERRSPREFDDRAAVAFEIEPTGNGLFVIEEIAASGNAADGGRLVGVVLDEQQPALVIHPHGHLDALGKVANQRLDADGCKQPLAKRCRQIRGEIGADIDHLPLAELARRRHRLALGIAVGPGRDHFDIACDRQVFVEVAGSQFAVADLEASLAPVRFRRLVRWNDKPAGASCEFAGRNFSNVRLVISSGSRPDISAFDRVEFQSFG
jgi:hypothetical protein